MGGRSALAILAACAAVLSLTAGPATAAEKQYYNGKTAQQVWHSGGVVTSTRNTSQGSEPKAHAYSRVGGIEAYSLNPGVVQTYSKRKAKVECGWANKRESKTVKISWYCKWKS